MLKVSRLDIDKHRRGAHARNGGRGRDEGDGGNDDFIAFADAQRFERHLERHGAVHRAQSEAAMLEGGEFLFEPRDDGMISAPAVARENFVQKFAFARSGNRPGRDAHTSNLE